MNTPSLHNPSELRCLPFGDAGQGLYSIGKIGKPHGVHGEVALHFTDDVFDRVDADYLVLRLNEIYVPFFMTEYRFKNDQTAFITFDGITTEGQARELTGTEVFFPRELSDSDEEGLTWAELIGFELMDDTTGTIVGTLEHVDDSTANVLFTLTRPDGTELLVPASDEIVTGVDADSRIIHAELPDGLLDL